MSRTLNGWPILTLAGLTAAVLVGVAHASFSRLEDCLLGFDDLGQRTDLADGFGADGYTDRA